MNSIRFFGAVDEVTGSKIEVSSWRDKVLLDCGMFQNTKDIAYLTNKQFYDEGINPDYVILSHIHLDHAGMLPALYHNGYEGNVYCTEATTKLAKYMLPDAYKIMNRDLPTISKMLKKRGLPSNVDLIYNEQDVSGILKSFISVPYLKETKLTDDISFKLVDSCHILGSASIKLTINQKGTKHKIWYTSDLGHNNSYLSKNPIIPQDITHLIIETTYGNKKRSENDYKQQLLDHIVATYRRKGKVIIPAFSIHRMQTIILILHKLYRENAIPNIPIYVDSPLGNKVTNLYSEYKETLNEDNLSYFLDQGFDPFEFPILTYINDIHDTERISKSNEPCIIISASGMCEGGMIRTYLKDNISNNHNSVLLVGYTAEGTLGRRLLDIKRGSDVTIDGSKVKVNCNVEYVDGFSAHADKDYLLDYIDRCSENNKLKNIYLIHGEYDAVRNMKKLLNNKGYDNVIIPDKGKAYKL